MRTKSILSMLLLSAAVFTFASNDAEAGFPGPGILIPPGLPGSSVNVHVNGYLPAPPGVNVQIDAGRPYYIESDRRVYIERERPHHRNRHYRRHHENHGNRYGHYKEDHGERGEHGEHGERGGRRH